MGKERVRAWPKKRGAAFRAKVKQLNDDFRQAQIACKYWDPRNIVEVDKMRSGTPILIRDLQTMMMYNRFTTFVLPDGRKIYPMAARQDVSDSLDAICPLPGALLVRTADGWRFVEPPTDPEFVLATDSTLEPNWRDPHEFIPAGSGTMKLLSHTAFATIGPANPIDIVGLNFSLYDYRLNVRVKHPSSGAPTFDNLKMQMGDRSTPAPVWNTATTFLNATGANVGGLGIDNGVARIAQSQSTTVLEMGCSMELTSNDDGTVLSARGFSYFYENAWVIDGSATVPLGAIRLTMRNTTWSGSYSLYQFDKI